MQTDSESAAYQFKIVLMGAHAVGKSSLIRRLHDDTFSFSIQETKGLSDIKKKLQVQDKDVILHIWDTAGTEKYRAINSLYIRQASGAIIVFDVTRRETFDDVDYWMKTLKRDADNAKCILVGNKIDMVDRRIISNKEAQDFARRHSLIYVESSAKDNICVTKSFETLTEVILEDKLNSDSPTKIDPLRKMLVSGNGKKKRKKCC